MKKKLIHSSVQILKRSGKYNDEQIEIIIYGLEGLYLTFTKMIIIFLLSILLGIFKEVFILLITYNIIRSQAFGIHASKSAYCLISSLIFFIGGAIFVKYIQIPMWIMITVAIICDICLLLYAPADTQKRPLINKKKRKRFRIVSFCLGIIYTIIILISKDPIISNYLLVGMVEAVLVILPMTYSIFKMPYNNYKNYYKDVQLISTN